SPVSAGNFSNAVVFTSNGGNSSNSVTGVGLTPAQLVVIPTSLDFGVVDVDVFQAGFAGFTVTNIGGSAITNGVATVVGGPFGVFRGSPFNLAGFSSAVVEMFFQPSTAGFYSNAVVFSSNGGNRTNTLTGTGA